MRTVRAAILLLTGMLLSGCFSDSTSDGEASIGPTDPTSGNGAPATPPERQGFRPQFQPLSGIFPYPNDLYFSGSTDGTLNLPAQPVPADGRDHQSARWVLDYRVHVGALRRQARSIRRR